MITFNLLDVLLLIVGWIVLYSILPDDFKEELGGIVGCGLGVLWLVVWIILFWGLGYDLIIIKS